LLAVVARVIRTPPVHALLFCVIWSWAGLASPASLALALTQTQ
jgi:hypothetical protein